MAKIHRSARGQAVDMDMIRLSNETTIAIGNQKVNARGDQLGPGGKIVKSRAEIMAEYHALNTEMANDGPIGEPVAGNVSIDQELLDPTTKKPNKPSRI